MRRRRRCLWAGVPSAGADSSLRVASFDAPPERSMLVLSAGAISPSAEPSRGTGRARRCRRRQWRKCSVCRCDAPSPAVFASVVAASPGPPSIAGAPDSVSALCCGEPGAPTCGGWRRRRRRRRRCGTPSCVLVIPAGALAALGSVERVSSAPVAGVLLSDGKDRSLGARSSAAVSGGASLGVTTGSSWLRFARRGREL